MYKKSTFKLRASSTEKFSFKYLMTYFFNILPKFLFFFLSVESGDNFAPFMNQNSGVGGEDGPDSQVRFNRDQTL